MMKDDAEDWRARAQRYVDGVNEDVHHAPWTRGRKGISSRVYVALELAELAYHAHGLPFQRGLLKMR
jgi:hypothetical protein